MIQGIQNLFSGILTIINGIKIAIEFLLSIVESMFEMLKLIFTTTTNTTLLIGTLPEWLVAIATATLGVSILYIVVGRDTGK